MRNNKSNKGFTLIELLIVIAIIGILAAVLIPNLLNARASANDTSGASVARNVATAAAAVAVRLNITPADVACNWIAADGEVEIVVDSNVEETIAAPRPIDGTGATNFCAGNTATSIVVSVPYVGGTAGTSPAVVEVSF